MNKLQKLRQIVIKVLAFPVKLFIIVISGIYTITKNLFSDISSDIKEWQEKKYGDAKFTNKQI